MEMWIAPVLAVVLAFALFGQPVGGVGLLCARLVALAGCRPSSLVDQQAAIVPIPA